MERPPVTDPDETEAKLAPLQPDTKYRITIRAMTSKGQGEPYYIEATTDEEPETAPDVPELIWSQLPNEEGKAGIEVTWIPVVDGNPGSHFFVQYRHKGENQWESTGMEETQDVLVIRGLEQNRLYEIRVITVDGHLQTASNVEEVKIVDLAVESSSSDIVSTSAWFIGMMCALALLFLIFFLVCLVKRNRGGKYFVREKQAAHGRDLDYPDDGGFNEYGRSNRNPQAPDPTSVNSSLKGPESETDSMGDFGEGEAGQFAEDGSFIGQYSAKKKKSEETTAPSALATFV
ncbi:neuroglian-like [Limulus polyphemus]|uniref:Neuroglian-like n=1 Tax=Limulus polyphemus TaxID=6850 RepID=A0ABM1C1C2_LIMPO|nr:neuroglian-like [Limulus polyphemus]